MIAAIEYTFWYILLLYMHIKLKKQGYPYYIDNYLNILDTVQSKMHKQIKRNRRQNDTVNLPSYSSVDTCGDGGIDRKEIG